jgi:uncharacterized protein YyaL (SSP411 family)
MENTNAASASSSPQFTNRLIDETSPYLQQHAHNPVDWYPWGVEAFQEAKTEDKPVLLSIGYSACHWCHVMEQESFENEEIAAIMNRYFINIKVDREERPDLDALYMNYVQMSTGSGGWPMTVFLTPDQVPFFGGTYFPPEDRYGRPGISKLLRAVAEAYYTKRKEIEEQGPEITRRLEQINSLSGPSGSVDQQILDSAFGNLAARFDWSNGGFGGAPKFPAAMSLSFCLRHHRRTTNNESLRFVELTLEKMARGGIFDQLGGGFHRYSVDDHWLVPHFEKMLYDNALLSRLYVEAYQLTHKPFYRRIAEEVLDYVTREMTSPDGGFYSTQDADSEGEEGKFFVWTAEQVKAVLGSEDGEIFCRYYGVTVPGNFEGANILHVARSLEDLCLDFRRDQQELEQILSRSRKWLYAEREKRVKPHRDDKILTGWNGLMTVSFVEAGLVLKRADYLEMARRNLQFLLRNLRRDERIFRTCKDGKAKLNGYLEDYANLVDALISFYEATGENLWLDQAVLYTDEALRLFWEPATHAFYLTSSAHEPLITRVREYYDNATPAGSSVAVLNLLRLALLTGKPRYREIAESSLEKMGAAMTQYPSGFGYLLSASDFYLGPVAEIVIVGETRAPETTALSDAVYRQFFPNKIVAWLDPSQPDRGQGPLLEGKSPIGGKPAVYICRNYTCQSPITNASELERQLKLAIPPFEQ